MAAAHHRGEEGARITAPLAGRGVIAVWDEPARQLLHVVTVVNFSEQVPFDGISLKWIEHDVAAVAVEEMREVAGVGIREYGSVTARNGAAKELANGGRLAGAGCSDEL